MKYTTTITASQSELDETLAFCREKFGHRNRAVWWWCVKKKYKDREFIFSFENEDDLIIFRLTKGSI